MSNMIPVFERYPELIDIWDYEKNTDDPQFIPSNIRKKYYFKCPKGHSFYNQPRYVVDLKEKCPYCSGRKTLKGFNDLWTTHPNIAKMLDNPNDGYENTYGSNKKVKWKCPYCNRTTNLKPISIVCYREKVPCNYCSDGVSYPEKVFISLLDFLHIKYIYQLSKTNDGFEWCENYRYDFYLPDYCAIIEINGGFHYYDCYVNSKKTTFEETIKNDNDKYELALHNGINNYITIDCRRSNFSYIKRSIENNNELTLLLNCNLFNVEWDEIRNNTVGSYIYEVCLYYNEHPNETLPNIGKIFKKSKGTIAKYLVNGTKLGLCSYDVNKHLKQLDKECGEKPVVCITTGLKFNSMAQASRYYNTPASSISKCCLGNAKISRVRETGEELEWAYAN